MRIFLFALALSPAFAQHAQVPDEIQDMYAEFCDALLAGDVDAAETYLTPMTKRQRSTTCIGRCRDLLWLAERCTLDVLEARFVRCNVQEGRALVEYDLDIAGTDNYTGGGEKAVWRHVDRLWHTGYAWQIVEGCRTDPERERELIDEGLLADEAMGIELPIPQGWRAHILQRSYFYDPLYVVLCAPDAATVVMLRARDWPHKSTPKGMFGMARVILARGGGGIISEGETTLAGKPAYQMSLAVPWGDVTSHQLRIGRADDLGEDTRQYMLVLSAEDADSLERAMPTFEQVRAGLKLDTPKDPALPPRSGSIADGKYENPACGFSAGIPEGWTARIAYDSMNVFQVKARPPEGGASLQIIGSTPRGYVDPDAEVQGWARTRVDTHDEGRVLNEGPVDCGALWGYQASLAYVGKSGRARQFRRACFYDYPVMCDLYGQGWDARGREALEEAWAPFLESLTFGPKDE